MGFWDTICPLALLTHLHLTGIHTECKLYLKYFRYLERQDFLERADLRRFEIEKEIRAVERSKRFNSTL